MYSLCSKLYTNYTQTIHWDVSNPTQELYTKAYTATIHSVFWTRIKRIKRMKQMNRAWRKWRVLRAKRTWWAKRKDGLVTGWWRYQKVSREQSFINIYILQKQSVRRRRSVVPTSRLVTPTNRSVTFPLKPGALLVFLRCAPSFNWVRS